jgi:hypothetical protein
MSSEIRRRVGVVGGGPRLNYLLNSLVHMRNTRPKIDFTVFDPTGAQGSGWAHDPALPPTMVMNRRADELSLVPDRSCSGWHHLPGSIGRPISSLLGEDSYHRNVFDGFPTRAVHGALLQASLAGAELALAPDVTVERVPALVSDVHAGASGAIVHTDRSYVFDEVLLLTGHGETPSIYRHLDDLDDLGLQRGVGVLGAGATGIDSAIAIASRQTTNSSIKNSNSQLAVVSRTNVFPVCRPSKSLGFELSRYQSKFVGPLLRSVQDGYRYKTAVPEIVTAILREILYQYLIMFRCRDGEPILRQTAYVVAEQVDLPSIRDRTYLLNGKSDQSDFVKRSSAAGSDEASVSERVSLHKALINFPYEVMYVLMDPTFSLSWDAGVRFASRAYREAEDGLGKSASATAVELVLREWRPDIVALTDKKWLSSSQRSAAFSVLVPAMNKLVNGPAPITMSTFLHLVDDGQIVGQDLASSDRSSLLPAYVNPPSRGSEGLLSNLVRGGVAEVGIEFGEGVPQIRVGVGENMCLTGSRSNGAVYAMGPHVDTGELLQASALRPGVDHPVMRDITKYIDGLCRRVNERCK